MISVSFHFFVVQKKRLAHKGINIFISQAALCYTISNKQ